MPWIRKCTFCADRQGERTEACLRYDMPHRRSAYGEREDLLAKATDASPPSPARYVQHIYGEKEVGGTSWLYMSPVPFEELGSSQHRSKNR